MNLLALECSSAQGSLAVYADQRLCGEETWGEARTRGQHLLAVLPALLERAALSLRDIEVYVVGRGPGNYSGLRIAFSAAQALALPDRRSVYALSSGEALAQATASVHPAPVIAVVGDARRERLWLGLFDRQGQGVRLRGDWSLVPAADLESALPADSVVVTPDGPRLKTVAAQVGATRDWIPESRYPTARVLGALALEKILRGEPSEPRAPLYMHPAV